MENIELLWTTTRQINMMGLSDTNAGSNKHGQKWRVTVFFQWLFSISHSDRKKSGWWFRNISSHYTWSISFDCQYTVFEWNVVIRHSTALRWVRTTNLSIQSVSFPFSRNHIAVTSLFHIRGISVERKLDRFPHSLRYSYIDNGRSHTTEYFTDTVYSAFWCRPYCYPLDLTQVMGTTVGRRQLLSLAWSPSKVTRSCDPERDFNWQEQPITPSQLLSSTVTKYSQYRNIDSCLW